MKISIISKMFFAFAMILSLASFTSEKKADRENNAAPKKVAMNAALFQLAHTNKVKLAIDKGTEERLRVTLKDKGGRTLYSEMFGKKEQQYRRVFNLDDMNDGTYYFELFYGDQKITKEVQLQTNRERVISLM